jgi:two-component system chemotaxis response regulator CheB
VHTVAIGASAGGIEALRALVSQLPLDFPAAVLVVLHMPTSARSALSAILARVTTLPVRQAVDKAPLEAGTVTVAVPDHHLLLVDEHISLSRGPRENGHRPAVDVLFRSAARAAGPRVIGVVLSGVLDDGTAGTIAVRARGGIGVAQHPADALYSSMPMHAIEVGHADHVAPLAEMGALLSRLVTEDVELAAPPPSNLMEAETAMADFDASTLNDEARPGTPSGYGCPSCHGALFTITEGGMERYRCRVGHAWSPEALAEEQAQVLEGALWMALRGLEERAALSLRMGERAEQRGHKHSALAFRRRHDEAQAAAVVLRQLLQDGTLASAAPPEQVAEG